MAELKIALWNCSGHRASTGSTAHKVGFFDKEFPKANFAIAVFVETHHKDETELPVMFQEYKNTHHILHTPTPPQHTHSGIIVAIRNDLQIISHTVKIEGRLLNFVFRDTTSNKVYNFSAFYGPILKDVLKKDLSPIIKHFSQLHSGSDNNIIIGDFNFVDNDLDKGQGMDGHDKKMYALWEDLKDKIQVTDPFRDQFPNTRRYSYVNNKGKSRVDRIYVSNGEVNNV